MSRSKESPKGKSPKEDRIVDHIAKVKPLEPWPDPPPKTPQGPQPVQKPSGGTSGPKQNPKQPVKKD